MPRSPVTTAADSLTAQSAAWGPIARQRSPAAMPRHLDRAWDAIASRFVMRWPRRGYHLRRARGVLKLEAHFQSLADDQLRAEAQTLRATFRRGRETRRETDRAFALVREAASRRLGLRPYREQVAAGLAMFRGATVELATGEGKTLAAALPAVLFGWRGGGCHIVTVNDYLAERDAAWMAPIYEACGVSVSHVIGAMGPDERRAAYAADVTYTTSREVAADFLRDRLQSRGGRDLARALLRRFDHAGETGAPGDPANPATGSNASSPILRGLSHAIVDEADSVLIDEAVTPLIISGEAPNREQTEAYAQAARLAEAFIAEARGRGGTLYRVNERLREVRLTERGRGELARLCESLTGLWQGTRRREELLAQALTARELFIRDQHYVVQEQQVVIVDEFTGRLMPERTWRDGLHQAIEAKEGLTVNTPKATLARMSFQRFFRHYHHICGMTGTGWEARHELWQTYRTPAVRVPTHRRCIRRRYPDRVFKHPETRWRAVVDEAKRVHQRGRPLLIGTRSVEDSERLSAMLEGAGLDHQVLNAVRHEEEAAIVAQAGRPGRITVATNMAGRGTDIKLDEQVVRLGGLHVIATQRHEARRIDRQLFGRAARQGQPGSAVAFVCLDDELLRRHGPLNRRGRPLSRLTRSAAARRPGLMPRLALRHAQSAAQRSARRRRRALVQQDEQLDENLSFAGPAWRD